MNAETADALREAVRRRYAEAARGADAGAGCCTGSSCGDGSVSIDFGSGLYSAAARPQQARGIRGRHDF